MAKCESESTCHLNCSGESTCAVKCPADASCTLDCTGVVGACSFTGCGDGMATCSDGMVTCSDGMVTCGRRLPELTPQQPVALTRKVGSGPGLGGLARGLALRPEDVLFYEAIDLRARKAGLIIAAIRDRLSRRLPSSTDTVARVSSIASRWALLLGS